MRDEMPYIQMPYMRQILESNQLGIILNTFAAASAAFAATVLHQTPTIYWVYLVMVVLDFASGVLANWGQLESGIAGRGAARKGIGFIVVAACELAGWGLKEDLGFKIPGGVAVAAIFTFQEFVSILENAEKAGMIPSRLRPFLTAIKAIDHDPADAKKS